MLFTFFLGDRKVEFGPYNTVDQAKSAFQRRFGFWPGNPISWKVYS